MPFIHVKSTANPPLMLFNIYICSISMHIIIIEITLIEMMINGNNADISRRKPHSLDMII